MKKELKDCVIRQSFSITSDCDVAFRSVCNMVFGNNVVGKPKSAVAYKILKEGEFTTLVLYWHEADGTTALPFPVVGSDAAYNFIKSWIDSLMESEIGLEYEEEASAFGFTATCNDSCNYEMMRFTPKFLYYSK